MPASIFEQGVPVRRVADGDLMAGSPRNYNATVADHGGGAGWPTGHTG